MSYRYLIEIEKMIS